MGLANTGTVQVTRSTEGKLRCVCFQWRSGAVGAVLNVRELLIGVLEYFVAYKSAGVYPYTIALLSEYGVDVLNAQASDIAASPKGPVQIRKLLDETDRPRSILAIGEHTFYCDAVNQNGTFNLYYSLDLGRALEHRKMY